MNKPISGAILPAALIILAVTASIIGVTVAVTSQHSRQAHRVARRTAALGYGDGVTESLFDQWRQAMISVTNATDRVDGMTTASLASIVGAPNATTLPPPTGISLVSWSLTAADPFLKPLTDANLRPVPENGTSSRLRMRQHYLANVSVRFAGATDVTNLQRVFVRAGRNLFDDFFFGTQQITEMSPGPEMFIDGSVYVGGDLYTPHNALHFLQNVTFTGSHVLNYRTNDSRYGTDPNIDNDGLADNWSPSNPPRAGQEQKLSDTDRTALDPNFLDDITSNDVDSDGNLNNDGYHEIIETAVSGPDPLQLDSATSERLSTVADYRIFVDASNVLTIYAGTSNTPLTSGAEYTAITALVATNTALKDTREKDYVRLTTLDVDRVRTGYDAGTLKDRVGSGDGLLIYVADTSAGNSVPTKVVNSATGAQTAVTSARDRGVRLTNGGRLPSCGLTVVSPNAVYVQGDYNSGKNGSAQPPSNTATSYTPPTDRPSPFVTGYDHAPAAIVGDAVNILSNAWNDANSLLAQSSRAAVNSTVNAAVVAGNVPTTAASYSGGIENFVRFHENWGSKYFTIEGALAQLFASQQATGLWKDADYNPPARRWYYDNSFRDRNPPGMRPARSYERGQWTMR